MSFFPQFPASLNIAAATPVAGTALVNGTPSLLTWTAPNDGQQHYAVMIVTLNVTSGLTGGAIQYAYTNPQGGAASGKQLIAGASGIGAARGFDGVLVQAGTTVTISQTAATGGAAVFNGAIIGA